MKKVLRLNGVPPYAKNEKGKKGRGNEKTEFLFKGLRFGLCLTEFLLGVWSSSFTIS